MKTTDGQTIDSLQIEVKSSSVNAEQSLESLAQTLSRIKSVASGGFGLNPGINQLKKLKEAVGASDGNKIKEIAQSLKSFDGIENIKISSSIASQLKKLNEAVNEMDSYAFIKLRDLSYGLSSLSNLPKSNLGSTLNQLKKLPEIMTELDKADLDAFEAKIKRLVDSLSPLATQMDAISRGFSSFPSKLQKATQATEKATRSNKEHGISYVNLYAKLKLAKAAIESSVKTIASWIDKSNQYIENVNLFTVSMGQYADAAKEYADTVGAIMGIDPGEWMRNQGIFMTLATGFSVASDRAYTMSKNLTQLGYDISSFFNISYEDSMQKLQSGLSGELEPLRRLGYDLSQARLQAVALSLGIDKAFNSMTQAEKAQLRYYAIMTQVTTAQGDMARTLDAPANQLRVLKAQVTMAARAIGNIFIPVLNRILPYAIAAVKVVRLLAEAIASLFKFELPSMDVSSIGNISVGADTAADSVSGIGSAAKGATDKLKELKNATLGIDELNVVSPNTPSDSASGGSGGSGGVGGGGNFDFPLPEYNFISEEALERVNEITDKIKSWLGLTEKIDNWSDFFNTRLGKIAVTAGLVGTAIGLWKISKSVGGFDKLLGSAKQLAGVAIAIGGAFLTVDGTISSITQGLDLSGLGKILGGTLTMVVGLGIAFGTTGALIGAAIGIVALMTASLVDMYNNGLKPINAIGVIMAASSPVGWILNAGIIVARFAKKMKEDAVPAVDLFADVSEKTEERVKPFLDKIDELQVKFKTLEYSGEIIKTETVNDVKSKVSQIVTTITDELDADKNESLKTLEPLKKALGEEAYSNLLTSNEKYYSDLKAKVTDGEERINTIMQNAADKKRSLTSAEWTEINKIQSEMQDTGIKHLSENEIESETIMRNLKDASKRISLEQASEIIQNAQKTRDESISAAENQYSKVLLEAKRMYDAGAINKDQYNEIIKAAEKTRDDAIGAAVKQYTDIDTITRKKLGETAEYLDKETGEIRTNWSVTTEAIGNWWSEKWNGLKSSASEGWEKFKTFYNEHISKYLSFDYWKEKGKGILNGLLNGLKSAWGSIKEWFSKLSLPNVGDSSIVGKIFNSMLPVKTYASGGYPETGQMFVAREAGPELVGRIGRKTAVVNNSQIVEAVSLGVYQAVSAAMPSQGEDSSSQVTRLIINLDGEKLYENQQKIKRGKGYSFGMGAFASA